MELPSLNSFGIVNSLGSESLEEQISLFLRFETSAEPQNDDFMLKKIGLLQAIMALSKQFNHQSESTHVKVIGTDKGRTILGKLDGGYWFFCEFSFGITANAEYSTEGLAPNDYLHALIMSGYDLWCLNFSSFTECQLEMGKQQFELKCTQWWKDWFRNAFEFPSSLALNGNGVLKLLNGARYSCLDLPFGFNQNIHLALTTIVDSMDELVHISTLNTNWTPESNWGVIHSLETDLQLNPIFNWFETIDQCLGLSTYALSYDNMPSIKEYIGNLKRLKSIAPDGSLFERSVIQPAMVLQSTFNEHLANPINEHVMNPINDNIINPLVSVVGTVASYIPGTAYVPNMFSYWPSTSFAATEEVEQQHSQIITEPPPPGKYILGKMENDSICIKRVYIKTKGEFKEFQLVVYELNGILFTLVFKNNFVFQLDYFEKLANKLNALFETYFQDLIVTQLTQLQNTNFKTLNPLYLSFKNGEIYSTLGNIPPFEDMAEYEISKSHIRYNTLDGDETNTGKRLDMIAKHNLALDLISRQNGSFKSWRKALEKLRISRFEWVTLVVENSNEWRIEWHRNI